MKRGLDAVLIVILAILLLKLFTIPDFLPLDLAVSNNIQNIWTPQLNQFMIFFSETFIVYTMIAASAVIFFVFLYKKRNAKLFALALLVSLALVEAIKFLVHRARPLDSLVVDVSFGFPSSHTAMSMIFALMVIYLFKDSIKSKTNKVIFSIALILIALFTGFSRVYLNIHWLSDVLAGLVLAFAVFLVLIFVYPKRKSQHHLKW